MNVLDPLFFIFLIVIGFNIKNLYPNFNSYERKILNYLFVFHVFISFAFYYTVSESGGDAIKYWYDIKTISFDELKILINEDFDPTFFIYLLNYIPSNVLDLSFYIGNLMYGVMGYWGFVIFLQILKYKIPHYQNLRNIRVFSIRIFPLLLFMPNLHFWSSGIGKDTIMFFTITLFIYALVKKKHRVFNIIFTIVFIFLTRQHILLFLVAGFGVGYILSSRIALYKKVFLGIIALIILIPLLSSVLEFAKIDNLNSNDIEEFSTTKADNLSEESGSGIDISSYPFPLKVLTFLYRPLFFDASSVLSLIVSLENAFYLILTLSLFKKGFFNRIRHADFFIKGNFYFFLISSCAFSLILGNLGIIIRQKTMVLVSFLLIVLYINSIYYLKNISNRKI